jgi:hypothetical protein
MGRSIGGAHRPGRSHAGGEFGLRQTTAVWQRAATARQRIDARSAVHQFSVAGDSSHPAAATGGGTWKVSDTWSSLPLRCR